MTRTLQDAIAAAIATVEATPAKVVDVSDAAVARLIASVASKGYRPSECTIPALRSVLSGNGVILAGPAGVGKTFLMRCLGVRCYDCAAVADYGIAGLYRWYDWTDGHELCLDDLGAERTTAEYGAKDEVLKSVIAHRAERQRARTHITTNLDAAQIRDRYGDRTLSRILGMCVPHRLSGSDRRRAAPSATVPAASGKIIQTPVATAAPHNAICKHD